MADAEVRISIQDTALVSRGQPETARWQDSRNLFERNMHRSKSIALPELRVSRLLATDDGVTPFRSGN